MNSVLIKWFAFQHTFLFIYSAFGFFFFIPLMLWHVIVAAAHCALYTAMLLLDGWKLCHTIPAPIIDTVAGTISQCRTLLGKQQWKRLVKVLQISNKNRRSVAIANFQITLLWFFMIFEYYFIVLITLFSFICLLFIDLDNVRNKMVAVLRNI